ncbi:glycosyl hydrolase family 88 protein [Verticillium alfalfae VaMs.102]|uniref:Glycosyl hydrolase family 88 protein n=1 Tax=Verticillium alfalfae (strain VaMs.102 / ATCC MYA-4576 / FGSC 10136) TaxID=526221 RepID=C9SYT3_VERA1|nr:glycosyl hydrolase family 88 protein [Verticillium alfalfae VaMs.102]EEY23948.1 glycosyl hydrolase family 88 protein [Verticillium alfalfae VaMs.102]
MSSTSRPASEPAPPPPQNLAAYLPELFDESVTAKALRVAQRNLQAASASAPASPIGFPETVPQAGPNAGIYSLREADFWTCGFFAGHLAALLERAVTYPQHVRTSLPPALLRAALARQTSLWSAPLHALSSRTDTHDLGFMLMPALRRTWELTHDAASLASLVAAADSLATRYEPGAAAIRSWDVLARRDRDGGGSGEAVSVSDGASSMFVIIDSMCNLDLLYYAAAHAARPDLAVVATAHARTLLRTHLRQEPPTTPPPSMNSSSSSKAYAGPLFSTHHVANLDPATGAVRWRRTAQGYSDTSTWARGQAWAVLGYAQTYAWTRDAVFLAAACGLAEHFLARLDGAPPAVDAAIGGGRTAGRYVPLWDFDAPLEDDGEGRPLRDTSAGVIAANGLLVLAQSLAAIGKHELSRRFFEAAVRIVRETLDLSLAAEKARFVARGDGPGRDDSLVVEDVAPGRTFDAILKNGTANNNEHALRRLKNHGLVYGDYYLVEFGNRLMKMGFI